MQGMGLFSAFVIPLAIIALLLRDRGPVSQFRKAGAVSPTTARRPQSVEITRLYMLDGPVRRGVLIKTEDGRYWVDQDRLRQSHIRLIVMGSVAFLAACAVAGYWWLNAD